MKIMLVDKLPTEEPKFRLLEVSADPSESLQNLGDLTVEPLIVGREDIVHA